MIGMSAEEREMFPELELFIPYGWKEKKLSKKKVRELHKPDLLNINFKVAEPSKDVQQLSLSLIQDMINDGYSEHYIKQIFNDVKIKYEKYKSRILKSKIR
jgi:hypothetical protein